MIILIATVCILVAFFVTRGIMGDVSSEEVSVPKVEAIEPTITPPDTAIFNSNAINPAVEVQLNGTD